MSFYDIIQALLRWLKNSSAFSAKMAQLYNSVYTLTFFALIVCHDIGKETASNAFDSMLRNVGVIDEFFTSTQEFLLRMPVVEFEGVLGVFGVCVRQYSFLFGK